MKDIIKRRIYLFVLLIIWYVAFCVFMQNGNSNDLVIHMAPPTPIIDITTEMSNFPDDNKFDNEVKKIMKRWKVRGASLAVMKDDNLIYAKGYGYADQEMGIKCEPYSKFRIASMSKLITAITIMKMVDDGLISLNSYVFGDNGILNQYTKYTDHSVEKITVEHLLRHEGGFTTPIGDPMFKIILVELGLGIKRPVSTKQTIDYTISRKLGFRPGDSKKYSNVGYLILSEIIEKKTGKTYEQYVKKNILLPAGCFDTHIADNLYEDRKENEVRYYSDTKDDFTKSYNNGDVMAQKAYGGNDVKALKGAGAWISTTTDMLRLALAVDGENGKNDVKDILSTRSVNKLQTDVKSRISIGWADVTGGVLERTGTFSGTTCIMRFKTNDYSWIVLTNTSSWTGYRLNSRIKSMMRRSLEQLPNMPSNRNLFNQSYVKQLSQELEAKEFLEN